MVEFIKKHPGWSALIALGGIGGVLFGLNRVFKLETSHLAPLRPPKEIPVSSGIRWNARLKRWQNERGHFVKNPRAALAGSRRR